LIVWKNDFTRSLVSFSSATKNRSQSLLYFKMPLKSHLIATCFGLTRQFSDNCSPVETAALHQFVCQCIPCYCISSFALTCVWEWTLYPRSSLLSFCGVHVVPPSCVVVMMARNEGYMIQVHVWVRLMRLILSHALRFSALWKKLMSLSTSSQWFPEFDSTIAVLCTFRVKIRGCLCPLLFLTRPSGGGGHRLRTSDLWDSRTSLCKLGLIIDQYVQHL
jgi:hypothetical protein